MNNTIYITGEITVESFMRFQKKLNLILEETQQVYVELNSEGGDAYAAMAYFDLIQRKNKNPGRAVNVTATGLCASAAVLILAAGKRRYMTKSAWVMVHEDTTPIRKGMQVSAVEKEAKHARRLEVQWAELLADVTSATSVYWEELHKNETYLNAKECLELGLIEEII